MKSEDIIEPVTKATEWCAPSMPVPKASGKKVRIRVDLRCLYRVLVREKYPLPTVDDVLHKLSKSQVFTRLDARSGYWQIPLDEESSLLTPFITPMGRFKFKRLPFGMSCASMIFQWKKTELLPDISGVEIYKDDILVHATTVAEHDVIFNKVMDHLRTAGLKLNSKKCEIRKMQLEFLGHYVSGVGKGPHPEKIMVVSDLRAPENVSEVRHIMGMSNYLGRFLPNLAETARPINGLLKKKTVWTWGPPQEAAFKNLKDLVTSCPVLAYYNVDKPTILSADASSYSLGAVLMQQHEEGLKPVAYCSRTLNDAERKYAQIEKELLATTWVCEKFARYLVRLSHFVVYIDHKPLVPPMNQNDIDQTPVRCQRLLLRLMRFNLTAQYIRGKDMVVADALSRMPLAERSSMTDRDVESYVHAVRYNQPFSDKKLESIRKATENDSEIQIVMRYTLEGWPRHCDNVLPEARTYHHVRDELSVADGLLLRDARKVIPRESRAEIMDRIHDGHQGVTKCRERARQGLWWPGLSTEISVMVSHCSYCQTSRNSQSHETLMPTVLPERPWQHVGCDVLTLETKDYLMDYHSRYVEIAHMPTTKSTTVIAKLKSIFARWGIPERSTSDNGPQFTADEFIQFAESYGIYIITSSPGFPQANGESERAAQIAKRILRQDDPALALMIYRSTPVAPTGKSPSELMLGRRIRTTLPAVARQFRYRSPDQQVVESSDAHAKDEYARQYNKRHGAKDLPPLKPGDHVRVRLDNEKSWSKEGTVVQPHDAPRSYIVETSDGGTYRRYRKHLLSVPPPTPPRPPSPKKASESSKGDVETIQTEASESRPKRDSQLPFRFKDYQM